MGKCRKTVRYRDQLAAKIALARILRRDKADRPKQERRAYPCPECKGWHLTSRTS